MRIICHYLNQFYIKDYISFYLCHFCDLKSISSICLLSVFFLCVHTHILITLGCDKYQFATLVSCHFHSKRKDTPHNLVEWEDGRVPITIYHIRFDINLRTTAIFCYKHWFLSETTHCREKWLHFCIHIYHTALSLTESKWEYGRDK